MKTFNIHQNFTQIGVNYYIVQAISLQKAIAKVENGEVEIESKEIFDFDYDFEGSTENK